MAVTRHATGHSAPRKSFSSSVTTALFGPKTKQKPSTKTTAASSGTTANTSKPRAKTVAGGRVGKKTTTTTTTKATAGGGEGLKRRPRKTGVKDKVQGLLEKAVGTVEGKPGKKVSVFFFFFFLVHRFMN